MDFFENFPKKAEIETINFYPTKDFIKEAQDMLWKIFWQAPSDSILKLKFRKNTKGFVGLLQVRAMQKSFCTKVNSQRLDLLPEILQDKMSLQLMEWKKARTFS